jgi:hypothetical protein
VYKQERRGGSKSGSMPTEAAFYKLPGNQTKDLKLLNFTFIVNQCPRIGQKEELSKTHGEHNKRLSFNFIIFIVINL